MSDEPEHRFVNDDFGLSGKTALVTGSGRNIGRAIALELAARGANIIVNALGDEAEADAVAKEVEGLGARSLVVMGDASGTVQRSGGSSRLRQLWAWRGDWIEHTTEPGAEHAVVDRATELKKQIGASPRPSHLLRFIHSPVDQEIRGTFGN